MGKGRTRLRKTVDIVAAIVLLVAGTGVWLLVTDHSPPQHQRLTPDLASRIVVDMTSADPTRVSHAVAWPGGEVIDPSIVAGLAAGQISFDVNGFGQVAEDIVAVPGTLRIAGLDQPPR